MQGIFKGWIEGKEYGFINVKDGMGDVFLHIKETLKEMQLESGDTISFDIVNTNKGRAAKHIQVINKAAKLKHENTPVNSDEENSILDDDIEDLDTSSVDSRLLREIMDWKREAKAEDNYRYFWHVKEVDQISQGKKYFVIGRKGSGKTAICEHL